MAGISEALKRDLIADLPVFKENTRKFYAKEIAVNQYKGLSGPFGSYAERGAATGMSRWRFPAGIINHGQLSFLAAAIRRYHLTDIHFTTGESIQFHHLDGDTIVRLFQECYDHGIYNRGGGGDHPRNVVAPPLRGIDPTETWDISPYVTAASEYSLTLVKGIRLPRKLKNAFSSGADNRAHVTYKDMGFKGLDDGTFDIFAAGGLGPNPKMGVQVGSHVDPGEILYYIKAMAMLFSTYGDYNKRSHARTRYLQEILGGADAFREKFLTFLQKTKETEKLTIDPALYCHAVHKTGVPDDTLSGYRVGRQKQEGLYYVLYHPTGGNPAQADFLSLLDYLSTLAETEIRLSPDEGAYIVNLTADEARQVLALTEDGAKNSFEASVSCIGAAVCQVGLQDSQGLLGKIVAAVKASGIDSSVLPQLRISGCPSSCGAHQAGTIGFYGFVKKMVDGMVPAFVLTTGGSERFGSEKFGEKAAVIAATEIPAFIVNLAGRLKRDGAVDFSSWLQAHEDDFLLLAKEFEAK